MLNFTIFEEVYNFDTFFHKQGVRLQDAPACTSTIDLYGYFANDFLFLPSPVPYLTLTAMVFMLKMLAQTPSLHATKVSFTLYMVQVIAQHDSPGKGIFPYQSQETNFVKVDPKYNRTFFALENITFFSVGHPIYAQIIYVFHQEKENTTQGKVLRVALKS